MLSNILSKDVREWLTDQPNKCLGAHLDRLNRFLLPLDTVAFGYLTDQGYELFMVGHIKTLESDGYISLECDPQALKYNCDKIVKIPGYATVRFPPPNRVHARLLNYYRLINQAVLAEHPELSINGKLVLDSAFSGG